MKRSVIPINFAPELIRELKAEALAMGLALATYVRHLVITHPNRKRVKPMT